jgi:hypothetical protein
VNPGAWESVGFTVLAQQWAGRQFDDVKILTGSTDKSCDFLGWAHCGFGVKQVSLAGFDMKFASFITPAKSALVHA